MIVLAGLLLGAGQYGFLFVGMASGVTPGAASVLIHTQAIVMVAVAAAVLGERLRPSDAFSAALALVGIVLLAAARDAAGSVAPVAMVLAGAVCGGVGNLVLKRAVAVSRLGLAVWMSLVPPLPLLALSFAFEGPERITTSLAALSWQSAAALAYASIGATVIAFALWGHLFSRYTSIRTAPFLLLVPLVGLASSALWLDETLSPEKAGGAALVLAGLAVVALRRGGAARGSPTPPRLDTNGQIERGEAVERRDSR